MRGLLPGRPDRLIVLGPGLPGPRSDGVEVPEATEIPRKRYYTPSEVCQFTNTQPYVLRFWESEFPQLQPGKSASGQRLYRQRDVDVVRRIKELLHDEEYTLDRARKLLREALSS